ncbi:hypothetical protein HYS31_03625 [Candidatus Woesearchaeota archaeon]|nr:hypothetical protein [Candidatus Woesearchaeota archaeon]
MPKRAVNYLLGIFILLSLSVLSVNADQPGTCRNPNGGNYCNQKSGVSECFCDSACTQIGDCCSDYKQTCNSASTVVQCGESSTNPNCVCQSGYFKEINKLVTGSQIVYHCVECPEPADCVAPQDGCHYEGAYDSNGCFAGCGKLVCTQCTKDSDCPEYSCPNGGFVHAVCENQKCTLKNDCPTKKCATYTKNGQSKQFCATCGNNVCEPYETCTSSSCTENACTADCGGLYCPKDCDKTNKCGNGICEAGEEEYICSSTTCPVCDPKLGEPCPACPQSCEMKCPQDCSTTEIKEQVKCVFQNSVSKQECYSEKGSCTGVGTCVVDVKGKKGEQVTWKSSCGGYAYTTIDGTNEHAYFSCGTESCTDSDGGIDYYVQGWTKNKSVSQNDYCTSAPASFNLVEFYCAHGNSVVEDHFLCPNGCKDGACISKNTISKKDVINWIDENCASSAPYPTPTTTSGSSGGGGSGATGYVVQKIFVKKEYWKD